jgi:hypothetical protein
MPPAAPRALPPLPATLVLPSEPPCVPDMLPRVPPSAAASRAICWSVALRRSDPLSPPVPPGDASVPSDEAPIPPAAPMPPVRDAESVASGPGRDAGFPSTRSFRSSIALPTPCAPRVSASPTPPPIAAPVPPIAAFAPCIPPVVEAPVVRPRS